MRPKLTWREPRWSRASFVDALPDVRATYGTDVAEVVEEFAEMIKDRLDGPTGQDVKATLRAVAAHPESARLDRLDPLSDAALDGASWRLFRVMRAEALTPERLARCARDAMERLRFRPGRPPTDDLALAMLRQLRSMRPESDRASWLYLMRVALRACRLAHGDKTLVRLNAMLGQDF